MMQTMINELKSGKRYEYQRETIGGCEWLETIMFDGAMFKLNTSYWSDGNMIKENATTMSEEKAKVWLEKNSAHKIGTI